MKCLATLAIIVLFFAVGEPQSFGQEARSISTIRLNDTVGKEHSCDEWVGKRAIVIFFLATECPAVNGYAPTMERIASEYRTHGALVYGVHCDPDLTAETARLHAKEYGLTFPILLDPEQTLARQTGTTRTATAVVADGEGHVRYRGRIDDRYPALGKRRDDPRTHELEEALNAVLAGKKPEMGETDVVGCPLPKIRRGGVSPRTGCE